MKIYLISQTVNKDWNTYDSFVVYAENEEDAKLVHPLNDINSNYAGSWVQRVEDIQVTYLGEAKDGAERGEILSSYNAG